MDVNVILNLIMDYGPSILTVVMLVITTLAQKSNLFNGLKTIKQRAEELKASAEFKDVTVKISAIGYLSVSIYCNSDCIIA